MKNEKLMNETELHYARMFGWILTQNLNDNVGRRKIKFSLGENWMSSDCPYCVEYFDSLMTERSCRGCPLIGSSDTYSIYCCGGWWYHMYKSKTWFEFLPNMFQVIKYIRKHG